MLTFYSTYCSRSSRYSGGGGGVVEGGDLGINYIEKWRGNTLEKKERNRGGHEREKEARREKGKSKREKREEQRRTRMREGGREGMRTGGERRGIQ
jgi:hypothetical protein